jgi:uncharacterized iron-regulated membrane protein
VRRSFRPSNQALFRFHGWLGINLGLLLFIVCFSGAVATFSHEIEWLLNPAMRAAPPTAGAPFSSWTSWYVAAQRAHPGGSVLALDRPEGPRRAARATVAYSNLDWRYVYIDPYTGRVNGSYSEFGIARFFRSFHKQFYIYPGSLPHGVYAVGPLGLVLLLSLFTGLLFYRFRWRDVLMRGPWRTRRAFWSALHRATGMWTVPMAILITATGVWYFVERAIHDADIYFPPDTPSWIAPESVPAAPGLWPISLDAAVALAAQAAPTLDVSSIAISRGTPTRLTLTGQSDAWLVRDAANSVRVNADEGRVERVTLARALHPVARWAHTADPLHFGTFGEVVTKTIWFAAGLFCSLAILLGIRVWYMRSVPDPGLTARPASALASISITIVVLAVSVYGCMVNIGDALHSEPAARFASIETVDLAGMPFDVSASNTGSEVHVLAANEVAATRDRIRLGWAWIGDASAPSAVPADATPLAGRWDGLTATIPLRGNAASHGLWLAVEDAQGARIIDHSIRVPGAVTAAPVPEVVPLYVWIVIGLFGAICAAACIAANDWIQRSTSAAARRSNAVGQRKPNIGGNRTTTTAAHAEYTGR